MEQSNRIRELREARRLTLRDLADKAGLDTNKIHRLETGGIKLDLDSMRRVAKALGLKPSALLLDDDVELRADPFTSAIFDQLDAIAPDQRPEFLHLTEALVRIVRGTAARQGALAGDPLQVSQLAEIWNAFAPADRDRALGLLQFARAK